ncbi:MAG: HNH endonuclease [Bryobacteraceae bacterium]|jgi:hypothetical protein
MQPPFHITGVPNADWIIFIVGAIFCLYWLRALRLAREGARLFLRNLLKAIVAFCVLMAVLTALRLQTHLLPSQEQVIAGFVALIFFGRWQGKKRSRHIPTATRRAVIERDLKGEKFDPEKHHIDHVWPFSRGGSHTTDNLRVFEKKKNLRKGAKRPRLREMW